MQYNHLDEFPKPLLDDLVRGNVLPIVGAGLSRNAVLPTNTKMPMWDDLGRDLSREMPGYPYSGALDAISAYSHEYSRIKLVERLFELLLIDKAVPGEAHRAFCSIPFELVFTTNFDFLLEREYSAGPRHCRPVIDEDQLSISTGDSSVLLLKLHGDLHHPQRLVLTEDDYDRFLDTYPLMATFAASMLIYKTPLLIGYSLDDPDFRKLWQIIGDRLGKLRRPAYSIMVDANSMEVARFARRGVKVISIKGDKSNYGLILTEVFDELRDYWDSKVIEVSQVTEEDPLQELSLPRSATTRLCFFAVPSSLVSAYRERVFPIAQGFGLVPIVANDLVTPGDSISAKITAIIERSSAVIVDLTSSWATTELLIAASKLDTSRILAIIQEGAALPSTPPGIAVIRRSTTPNSETEAFYRDLSEWFKAIARELAPRLGEEPRRLLGLGEYRAAVISAISLLESSLRDTLTVSLGDEMANESLMRLVSRATLNEVLDPTTFESARSWIYTRNKIIHENTPVDKTTAESIVNGVLDLIERLQGTTTVKDQPSPRGSRPKSRPLKGGKKGGDPSEA